MPATKAVKIGTKAPDFVLKDNRGKELRLSELKGKRRIPDSFLIFDHMERWQAN
jgi:peroxiredoxin